MSQKNFWLGALVGSVIGSAAALLLAPKKGSELRKDIADGARQVSDKSREVAGKVGGQTSEVINKVKGKAQEVVSHIHALREKKVNAVVGEKELEVQISASVENNEAGAVEITEPVEAVK
ncbi:YtxH domain-containing protein [Paenibacillus sp. YPG26]|uniref:YtxH domain-containing protein n=1 Tax=Paenibacillus sp. YPG26 TaxID=2878915 RepID=UPI00203CF0C7|nr:YtxH domain-containing protein [Paenibacillus sp. YPG26]USB32271.1 YtxH domain-containing protein [Paenibacillus sp. YPG26]